MPTPVLRGIAQTCARRGLSGCSRKSPKGEVSGHRPSTLLQASPVEKGAAGTLFGSWRRSSTRLLERGTSRCVRCSSGRDNLENGGQADSRSAPVAGTPSKKARPWRSSIHSAAARPNSGEKRPQGSHGRAGGHIAREAPHSHARLARPAGVRGMTFISICPRVVFFY